MLGIDVVNARRVLILWLVVGLLLGTMQAEQKKKHSVTLKWNAPAARVGTVVGYNVYRRDRAKGHYALIAKQINALTYIDDNLQSGHTYYYKVTSVDAQGRESTAATTKARVP